MQHPTAANITVLAGTVRGLEASDDMSSIKSVVVRKPDGTNMHLNDVALVVGQFFVDICYS
jgi:Cu/Ag efflux pump CusA